MKSHENTFPKNDENCHRFMPSFVVTCGVGISIDSHLLTFHCGEVSAAHPGIRISDEWRLPQIWCFSQYLPMGSFGKPGATLPSRIPPRYQAPMLRICRPPWGVSPAVMLVPQTSEVPGPRNSRCLRFFGTVFFPHLSPILHPPSPSAPGGQQGGKLWEVYLAMDCRKGRFAETKKIRGFDSPKFSICFEPSERWWLGMVHTIMPQDFRRPRMD